MKNTNQKTIIAIDGMAATGKGVLAKRIASHYNFFALDSGKIYRLLALKLLENKLIDENFSDDWTTNNTFSKKMTNNHIITKINDKDRIIDYSINDFIKVFDQTSNKNTLLDKKKPSSCGVDKETRGETATKKQSIITNLLLNPKLKDPKIASFSSMLAKNNIIRQIILEVLKKIIYDMQAIFEGVVIDGRDIGTVVAPFANYKFFLTADPFIRAKRRFLEQKKLGFYDKHYKKLVYKNHFNNKIDYLKSSITKKETEELNKITDDTEKKHIFAIMKEIKARDIRDKTRNIAPCIPAKDATIINTSNLSENDVFSCVASKINQK